MLVTLAAFEWGTLVSGLLSGGGIAAGLNYLANRGKAKADTGNVEANTAVTVAAAWETLLQPMRDEIRRLDDQHQECEERNKALTSEAAGLREEVTTLCDRVAELERKGT